MQSTEQMKANRSLPTLSLNSQGEAVKYLQEILNYYGYSLKVDGIFGKKTEDAVKKFQKSRSLKVDGIVGPKTWNALLADYMPSRPILRVNSQGDDVKYLQEVLNCCGYSLKVDGIFGSKTEEAVKHFQKSRSLKVDGIVGPKTWNALLADYMAC